MAPFDVTSWGKAAEPAIHVGLGFGFGFVLERAGFGSAKKLTNQFYLNDMTVLKVMFSAIVTAMVLVLVATTFGWLDYDKIWVNPTYLGSGIVGGLLFGVGFVVGGFCPGTAIVSAATLKIDGLLFALGVFCGIFVFGYTEPLVDAFWNDSGSYGRLTLFDWLGLPMPVVVLFAVVMALAFFAGGEWIERIVAASGAKDEGSAAKSGASRRWRPAYGYAMVLVGTTLAMLAAWVPTESLRSSSARARVEVAIARGQVQVEPAELADLMRGKRATLRILDLRDEAAFNHFHLLDALRLDPSRAELPSMPARSIKILVAESEAKELELYRRLASRNVEHLYVLAGGIKAWSSLFDAQPRVESEAALGANHAWSRPPVETATPPRYVARVKLPGLHVKKSGGGCGG